MMLRQLFALCLLAAPALADTGDAPAELDRTWNAALVYLPGGDAPVDVDALDLAETRGVILYAHGCSGIIEIAHRAGRAYADAGYAFVAPDSFARETKPQSCDPSIPQGGMHRAVLGWRQAEIGHAAEQLRALTDAPIALVGHSEGAVTTATFTGAPFAARVIEGWTCNAGWPEYAGLNAPEAEPVLALVARRDPWFRLPVLRGDCGEFMDAGDRSVVYGRDDPLYRTHWLSQDDAVQRLILDFLDSHM